MYNLVVHSLFIGDFENTGGNFFINVQENKSYNKFLNTTYRQSIAFTK